MKVNFNNVRKCAVQEYNNLVKMLNVNIIGLENAYGGYVKVDIVEIEEPLCNLRASIATIAMSYVEKDPDIIDVLGDTELEQFPGVEG